MVGRRPNAKGAYGPIVSLRTLLASAAKKMVTSRRGDAAARAAAIGPLT